MHSLTPDHSQFIRIGRITYHNATNGKSPQMIKGRLQLFQEQLYFSIEQSSDTLQQWHLFKDHWPSISTIPFTTTLFYQMFQQIAEEKWLHRTTSMEDMTILFNLQFQLPVFLSTKQHFDLQHMIESVPEGKQTVYQHFFFPQSIALLHAQEQLERAAQFFDHIHGGQYTIEWL